MALGTLQSSGRLQPLQREPARRGEATGLLGGEVLWLEARRLELELLAMAAEGGRRDPERRGNLSLGTDRDGLGVDIPAIALSWGALEVATAKQEVEGAAVVDLPSARRHRKKTTLPLVGWASSGDG